MLSYIGLAVALWVAIDILILLLIGPKPQQAEDQQRGAQISAS
jgi:hypothetical protein